MTAVALIPVDLERTPLGRPGCARERLAGRSILEWTVERARRIAGVERVVVVHPRHQAVAGMISGAESFAVDSLDDPQARRWRSARKWAPHCWRGALGGATIFDECLPPGPLLQAMDHFNAAGAILLRGEWCLVDPALCSQVLGAHLEYPEAMKACFTQAPPGLCGIAFSRAVLDDLVRHRAAFAHILGYVPSAPIMDPVGKDVNIAISPRIRDTDERFIPDTPRGNRLVRQLAARLGERFLDADAQQVTDTARRTADEITGLAELVTLELTPRRQVTGPITPQHYVTLDRPDLDVDLAGRLLDQLGAAGCRVMLGGLGDALLHPRWEQIVDRAARAGVMAIGVETDLLCDRAVLEKLLDSAAELIVVRLNADRGETYRRVMGADHFKQVLENLQWLVNERSRRRPERAGLPWIVPSLVKTADTVGEMEGFFDKWVHYLGHAIVDGPRSGCGLMPDLEVVAMTPPDRKPCRQLGRRMTILSDGMVARCDQDWLARGALGDARMASLEDIWSQAHGAARTHREGRFAELTLCGDCGQWHRP